jgi:predicted nucleic acid-binding protein
VIFVDSNVPMYLVGPDHPHRTDARRLLDRLAAERERLVTDAEVFQELLHRYMAISRLSVVQPAFDALHAVVDHVFPIDETDVMHAKDLVGTHARLSARDAVHVAVMRRHGIDQVLTFDRGFDVVAGLRRLPS